MQAKWTMAPWMRRRIARHIERGTSERVLACLIGAPPAAAASRGLDGNPGHDLEVGTIDLSNVIPFRGLAEANLLPVTRAS